MPWPAFPSSPSGVWAFCEIQKGDFVSFLYGARAHNLYQVVERHAVRDAENLPPWKPLTFKESGRTYHFPFRLQLKPVRLFDEPLVRAEFSYVAENLLLRGGYRKTHFQADQTTLQSVSHMGNLFETPVERLVVPAYSTFSPRFTRNRELLKASDVFRFQETILQALIRRKLSDETQLTQFISRLNIGAQQPESLEVLGEKALPQGHIDLLLKHRVPLGSALKIPMEVKLSRAQPRDVSQLRDYMDELANECPGGVLVAAEFSTKAVRKADDLGIKLVRYTFEVELNRTPSFDELSQALVLEPFD